MIASTGGRALVDREALVELKEQVDRLRELGRSRGVIAAALYKLSAEDERFQAQAETLYAQRGPTTSSLKWASLAGQLRPE